MSILHKIKQLQAARAEVAKLESAIEGQMDIELAKLPAAFGFETVVAFVEAVEQSVGRRVKKRGKGRKAAAGPAKRKRMEITDAIRAEVTKLVAEGKTGKEIAKVTGVSVPSIHNIKKAAGLTRARGSKQKGPAKKAKSRTKPAKDSRGAAPAAENPGSGASR